MTKRLQIIDLLYLEKNCNSTFDKNIFDKKVAFYYIINIK
jgi:hypothetical protein